MERDRAEQQIASASASIVDIEHRGLNAQSRLIATLVDQLAALNQAPQAGWRARTRAAIKCAAEVLATANTAGTASGEPRLKEQLRQALLASLNQPDLELLPTSPAIASGDFMGFRGSGAHMLTATRENLFEFALRSPGTPAGKELPNLHVVPPAAVSLDGRFLAASRPQSASAQVWDLTAGKPTGDLKDAQGKSIRPLAFAFSERDALLSVGAESDSPERITILLYDTKSLRLLASWDSESTYLDCLRFHPSGSILAASLILPSRQQVVRFWHLPTGKVTSTLVVARTSAVPAGASFPRRIDFSPDGRLLVANGAHAGFQTWVMSAAGGLGNLAADDRTRRVLSGGRTAEGYAAQFSPDGRWLATLDSGGGLDLWEADSGRQVAHAVVDTATGRQLLEWSPNGSLLACQSGSKQTLCRLHHPLARHYSLPFRGEVRSAGVEHLQFDAGERWLACDAGNVLMIDLAHLAGLQPVLSGDEKRAGLALAPAGDRLWQEPTSSQGLLWQLPSPVSAKSTRPPQAQALLALAFGPQGQRVGVGLEATLEVKTFDLDTGKAVWATNTPADQAASPTQLLFSPDGKQLATRLRSEVGKSIKVWDTMRGKLAYERAASAGPLFYRGESLFTVTDQRSLVLKDLQSEKLFDPQRPAKGIGPMTSHLVVAENGQVAVEIAADGSITIWDLMARGPRAKILGRKVAAVPDLVVLNRTGSRLAARDGARLKVWDTSTAEVRGEVAMQPALFVFANPVEQSDELLTVEPDGKVFVWKPGDQQARSLCSLQSDGPLKFGMEPAKDGRSRLWFSSDRKKLVHLANDQNVQVWSLPAGNRLNRHSLPHTGGKGPLWAALSPDGNRIAFLSLVEAPRAWDLDRGRQLWKLTQSPTGFGKDAVRLSRDGGYLAWIDRGPGRHRLNVIDLSDGTEMFSQSLDGVPTCCALAEQARLAAVGFGREVAVFDPRKNSRVALLAGHPAPVTDLAFDDAGKLLATACAAHGTISVWNAGSGERLLSLASGPGQISRVALSPTARWLVTGHPEGRVQIWDLALLQQEFVSAGLGTLAGMPSTPVPSKKGDDLLLTAHRLHLLGRYDEAIEAYAKVLAKESGHAMDYRDRGEALFQLHRYAEAAADFEQAKDLLPELPDSQSYVAALERRGLVHAEAGHWDKARPDLMKAIKAGADKDLDTHGRALLHLAAGDLVGYHRNCDSLILHLADKEKPAVARQVVWTCALKPKTVSDYSRLVELAEDGVDTYPKDPIYHLTLGAVLCRAGQSETAVQRLQHAAEANGGRGTPREWLFLAIAYHHVGHAADARKWLEKAERWLADTGVMSLKEAGSLGVLERLELLVLRQEAETLIGRTKSQASAVGASKMTLHDRAAYPPNVPEK
jgi:WD40 repeat protein/tetratricopeptide (TPR) repeat protein